MLPKNNNSRINKGYAQPNESGAKGNQSALALPQESSSIGSGFQPNLNGTSNNSIHSSCTSSIQQMILSQHPGNQNQLMYRNSILGASNIINPLQILPTLTSDRLPSPNSMGNVSNVKSANSTTAYPPTNEIKPMVNNSNSLTTRTVSAGACTGESDNQNQATKSYPNLHHHHHRTTSVTLGGVKLPPVPPNASTAQQVQIAAAAAAAEAAPPKGYHGPTRGVVRNREDSEPKEDEMGKSPAKRGKRNNSASVELTEEEKKQLNRDRNRQHARSTRLRKKAYVNKLKELVDGLHTERSEEARKRRVAVQHLAEVQDTRRNVVSKFLKYHSSYENDPRKWNTLLEDDFFLKQPLTPFRSFRTKEIEQSNEKECRICTGVDSIICDAASLSVMVESAGFRSVRWQHLKRDEFLFRQEGRTRKIQQQLPSSIVRRNSLLQHAVSSLSSSSGSSNDNSDEEKKKKKEKLLQLNRITTAKTQKKQLSDGKKVSLSSSSSGGSSSLSNQVQSNNDFHDYHAKPLPDPRLDGGSTDSDSPTNASDHAVVGKLCTDSSSSGDDEKAVKPKHTIQDVPPNVEIISSKQATIKAITINENGVNQLKPAKPPVAVTDPSVSSSNNSEERLQLIKPVPTKSALPSNIATSGGISHNIRPTGSDLNSRLSTAPAVVLPPFAGIGKRNPIIQPSTLVPSGQVTSSNIEPSNITPKLPPFVPPKTQGVASGEIISKIKRSTNEDGRNFQQPAAIDPDNGTSSSDDAFFTSIQSNYHINEDDMLMTENVLMCPFIFRTQDAVQCGALAECVMPGMLRAVFSSRNKLTQLEMVYDAMGFMQQLERASGNEDNPLIVPNSLGTSLQPNADEARVITTATQPYLIVSVNESWTRTTKYTQMESEGQELSILHGKRTDPEAFKRRGKPVYESKVIAQGQPACCTNIFYDKFGREFMAYFQAYPIASSMHDITHILHIFKELKENNPAPEIHFR